MERGQISISNDYIDLQKLSLEEQLMLLPELTELSSGIDVNVISKSKKICIFGVGESSIAGDIVSAYADDYSEIPVFNYTSDIVPGWVDDDTDVIIISYSGNNDIVNSVYDKALERKCRIYCITNNGKIKNKCIKDGNKLLLVPDGLTARSALGFELGLLASLIEKMGICDVHTKLIKIIPVIKEYRDSLNTDKRIYDLKNKLHDNTIAIYGSPDLRASCKRWKMSLNEDMGIPSFYGELPEFNHNEIVGWANHNQNDDDLRIVMLRGEYKNEVLIKIIDKTIEVLEESNRHVIDIKILGMDPIEKNMRAILLADHISQILKSEEKNPMSWRSSE